MALEQRLGQGRLLFDRATGAVAGYKAEDGSDVFFPAIGDAPVQRLARFASFGDSLSNNNTTGLQISANGVIGYLFSELQGGFDLSVYVQSGVGGNKYTDMLLRMASATAGWELLGLDFILLNGLTNDLASLGAGAAGFETIEVIMAGYQTVIDFLLTKAKRVIWASVHPNGQGLGWNVTTAARVAWRKALVLQEAMAAANPDRLKIAPWAEALTVSDVSSGQPTYPTPLANTLDAAGVHPNNLGGPLVERGVAALVKPYTKPMRLVLSHGECWQSDNTSKIITWRPRPVGPGSAASGSFAGTQSASFVPVVYSGTGTGVVALVPRKASNATPWAVTTAAGAGAVVRPTGLNGGSQNFVYVATTAGTSGGTEPTWPSRAGSTVTDGTVTWTAVQLVANDTKPGFWACLIAYTNAGTPAASSLAFRIFVGTGSGAVGNGFAVGSKIRAAVEYKFQGARSVIGGGPYLLFQKTGGTVQHSTHYDTAETDPNKVWQDDREGVLSTLWGVVETGVTAISGVDFGARVSATAGSMFILLADCAQIEVQ